MHEYNKKYLEKTRKGYIELEIKYGDSTEETKKSESN